MARIFSTPAAEALAKSFMHDVTLIAGIRTNDQRQGGYIDNRLSTEKLQAAKEVCEELLKRDFKNIDNSIKRLTYLKVFETLSGGRWKYLKENAIAKAIVYMAECLGLYWDDTVRTPYEIAEFQKSLLGNAVYNYKRYISAIKDKGGRKKSATSTAKSATSTTSGTTTSQGGYKQSGPQSANVRDLLDLNGNPGVPG